MKTAVDCVIFWEKSRCRFCRNFGISLLFANNAFSWHCRATKMDDAMCSVKEYISNFLEVWPKIWPCWLLLYAGMLNKVVVFNVKVNCGCFWWFFKVFVCYLFWEARQFWRRLWRFLLVWFCPIHFQQLLWHKFLSQLWFFLFRPLL